MAFAPFLGSSRPNRRGTRHGSTILVAIAAVIAVAVVGLSRPADAAATFFCPPAELMYAAGSGGGQQPNAALRDELYRGLGDANFWARAASYPAASISGWDSINGIGAFLRVG